MSEDKKADKALTEEYKTFNRETVAEKRAFKKVLDNMPELTYKVIKFQEDNITEVAYIRFRPAVTGIYRDSFDVKKARKDKPQVDPVLVVCGTLLAGSVTP